MRDTLGNFKRVLEAIRLDVKGDVITRLDVKDGITIGGPDTEYIVFCHGG